MLEQRNRGRIYLESSDPEAMPTLDARMMQDPADIEAMDRAMHFIHDLVQSSAMKKYYGPLLQPGPSVDWSAFARTTFDSYHHSAGTCVMGPANNPGAVVDQNLKVHGMDNLWIGDASIMPTGTHANTNLTCYLIGERVAALLQAAG
jgi:choline dehydrogenase